MAAEVVGMEELQAALAMLRESLLVAANRGITKLGTETYNNVRANYQSWGNPAPSTMKKREKQGYPAGPALIRTGEMLNSVKFESVPNQVSISMQGPDELVVRAIALEEGREFSYTPTAKSWAYLCWVLDIPMGRRPSVIKGSIPKRPVWEPAIRFMLERTPGIMLEEFIKALQALPFFK